MVVFGPTFGDEVVAAGLGGLPFSWGDDGKVEGQEKLTKEQQVVLNQTIAKHNPKKTVPPSTTEQKLKYLGLSVTELKAVLGIA